MAASASSDMGFVPMTSISKKEDPASYKCSDWVATEKVHGSSFQIYSDDGVNISKGSRRRNLDEEQSFVRCNIKELMEKYKSYAIKAWHIIHSEDRWEPYREPSTEHEDEEEDCSDDNNNDDDDDEVEESQAKGKDNGEPESPEEICRVRIYGELYGGGGVTLSEKSAVQKEILYSDEFRFYVFGITINKKWVDINGLVDICREAGFPYYAKPVCEPMASVDDLKKHLTDTGFMRTRSALTEREDDYKSLIEGVVMTPLTRPNFKLHAVKFLAPAFTDVRLDQFGKTKTANFCTKQRYHSVISKLDIHERNDTKLVVDMYIADILKEMQTTGVSNKLKEKWANFVVQWLGEDEYNADDAVVQEIAMKGVKVQKERKPFERNLEEEARIRAEKKRQKQKEAEVEEEDDEPMAMGLFDS